MKKIIPILIVVAIAAALGVGAWMLLGKGGISLPVSSPGVIEKEAGESEEEFIGKMRDIVALGTPMKCTYTQGDITSESYIRGKNMYGEVSQDGKTSYVIAKDNCMWNWTTGEAQGTKMCFEEDFWEMSEEYAQEGQASVPTDTEYRCAPAIFSDTKFNLPANINFMDLDELMQGAQE